MRSLLSIVLLFSLFSPVFSQEISEKKTIFEAVVKVHADEALGMSSWGTGTCVNIDNENIYILTNKHVIGDSKNISVQFYRQGHESTGIGASVVWTAFHKNEPVDIALLAVKRNQLNWTPTVVRFELDDKLYNEKSTILTIGCPKAGWPRAYKGHINKVNNGLYYITPIVEQGQSGSLLLNGDGTKAIGLIAWKDKTNGLAMTAEVIRKATLGQNSNYYLKQINFSDSNNNYDLENSERTPVACPNCPDGSCPIPDDDGGIFRRVKPKPDENKPMNPQDKPSEGIKIFPTYPGTPNPAPTPTPPAPTPPAPAPVEPIEPKVDEKYVALEKRVGTVEDSVKKNTEKLNSVEKNLETIKNSTAKLDEVPTQIKILQAQVGDLATKVGQKAEVKDIVTPGMLDKFIKDSTLSKKIDTLEKEVVKTDEISNLAEGFNKSIQEVSKTTETLNQRFDTTVNNQSAAVIAVLKKMEETAAANQQKIATEPVNNIYNDYGQVALGTGLPSLVILLIGWWIKNGLKGFLGQYAEKIIGLLGGLAQNSPFPPTPTAGKQTTMKTNLKN